MNILELLIDESVHTKVMKRREKELKRQGDTKVDIVDSDGIDPGKNLEKSVKTWGKNKYFQRLNISMARRGARHLKKLTPEQRKELEKAAAAEAKNHHYSGQATAEKDHISHYTVTKDASKTGVSDHEKGHAKQMERIYAHGGSKGIAKALKIEVLSNDYDGSPMEHNANDYGLHGDTSRVKKDREDIAKAYTKGKKHVDSLRTRLNKRDNKENHLPENDTRNFRAKNHIEQEKLGKLPKRESAIMDIEFK